MTKISSGKIIKEKFEEILYPSLIEFGFKPHPSTGYKNGFYSRDGGGGYQYEMLLFIKENVFVSASISILSSESSIKFRFYVGEYNEKKLTQINFSELSWEEQMEIIPFASYKHRGNGMFELVPATIRRYNPFLLDIFQIKPNPASIYSTRNSAKELMEDIKILFKTSLNKFLKSGITDKHISLDRDFKKIFWI